MNTVSQWVEQLRSKFEGQIGDVVADCDEPENMDACIRDMAMDIALDAGCPDDMIGQVVARLCSETE